MTNFYCVRVKSYSFHALNTCSLCLLRLFLHQLWYMISKTLAEEAAWKFTKENGIDMVAINPGLVIGPLLQPTLNTSVEPVLKLINGTPKPLYYMILLYNHSS